MKLVVSLALILALFAVWTMIRVENHRLAAYRTHPPEGRFVQVDGHPVHVVQIGEGPDLVLIHGASGSTRDWTFDIAPVLADRYRVTIFDRPGLGYTPPLASSGVTLDDQTDLLVAASRAVGVESPVVAGQSFGGAVLMNWAVRHSDYMAAAVDISGATHTWDTGRALLYRILAQPVVGPVLAHLIAAWLPEDYLEAQIESVFAPNDPVPGYADHIGAGIILLPEQFVANAQQRHALLDQLPAQMALYPQVDVPLEIIHGDADTTVGLSIHSIPLSQEVPGANLTVLPGVGHMPQHVAMDEVIAAIDRAALRAGAK
ncbi:alpha/beta fold hydrolase [Maritimibacter sp. DP1N21-5]|uniref:alpha/beta fold hydrolase n=1 Tax=Maritimibacter sp. DP1N21-5 TaxID=2836867 RepID=UPI001C48D2DF|nr:alpha/beta hydrolase [Maritimibacter sp. DP1N21-5]MBV7409820.1 alpha/beta hydrolase [Maritimibacter sp. DP1N21-5]